MGSRTDITESPIHEVRFTKPFAMAQYEVTFEEYDRFAKATGRKLPHDHGWGRARRPVAGVTWKDAKAYAEWLSEQTKKRFRLPSEAEWEFAASSRGTDTWAGTSDEKYLPQYAVYNVPTTEPVGSKKPNGLGLYDMSGNVWEWVADCLHFDYQGGAPSDGSAWIDSSDRYECDRLIRGGSWDNVSDFLRVSHRSSFYNGWRYDNIGFRLVQDIDP